MLKRKRKVKRLKYQPHWEHQFTLLYLKSSPELQASKAFCKWCEEVAARVLFDQSKRMEQAFVTEGFSSWNKAIERFKRHQLAKRHIESKRAITNKIKGTTITVWSRSSKRVTGWLYIRYLARQGLPFRGGDNDINSNLVQLTKLLKIEKIGTKTYTHHDIQNEFIKLMSDGIYAILHRLPRMFRSSQLALMNAKISTEDSDECCHPILRSFDVCIGGFF